MKMRFGRDFHFYAKEEITQGKKIGSIMEVKVLSSFAFYLASPSYFHI